MQDRREKLEQKITIILAVILSLAVVVMIIAYLGRTPQTTTDKGMTDENVSGVAQKVFVEMDKIVEVEVEKEVTQEVIQDGLNSMGVLVTEEYYFTMVENYVKSKTFMKFITTESSFIYSYDGVVTAGIDFSAIEVTKDDDNKKIIVKIPASEIQNVDIDFNSFKIYSEKEGMWNPIKMSDYNDSLVELKDAAINKAKERNILKAADDEAKQIITNFISGFVDKSEYQIVIE